MWTDSNIECYYGLSRLYIEFDSYTYTCSST